MTSETKNKLLEIIEDYEPTVPAELDKSDSEFGPNFDRVTVTFKVSPEIAQRFGDPSAYVEHCNHFENWIDKQFQHEFYIDVLESKDEQGQNYLTFEIVDDKTRDY